VSFTKTDTIFLSYSSEDIELAIGICDALRAVGLELWFDKSELRGGDVWDASIREQIKSCAVFIPIISTSTQGREEGYFRLEWKLAIDRSYRMAEDKAFFFPVVDDNTQESTARVPEKFRQLQWTRLSDQTSIDAFAKRVRDSLVREEQAARPPCPTTPAQPHSSSKSSPGKKTL